MTRADAWLLDPFGAGLGRWGGAPSSGGAPAWWQPIVAILTSGGATGYLWLKDEGIATSVGQPVAEWLDVTGAAAWAQPAASSLRPILQAGGLVFDGIDDRMNDGSSLVTLLTGSAWSVGCGYAALTPGTSVWWAATDGTTTNLYNPTTSTSRLSIFGGGGSDNLFAVNVPGAPGSAWYGRNGTDWSRRLSGAETTALSARTPVGLNNLTLGARRSPSAGVFMTGTVAWVAITNKALTPTERAAIEALLTANGYPI